MEISFDLNLEPSYAEVLHQQHGALDGQRFITDLEDKIGGTFHQLLQRHQLLPAVGDRVQIDNELTVVVTIRSFEIEGGIWFSVRPYEA